MRPNRGCLPWLPGDERFEMQKGLPWHAGGGDNPAGGFPSGYHEKIFRAEHEKREPRADATRAPQKLPGGLTNGSRTMSPELLQ